MEEEEKPFLSVVVHSFFIIPFLIAVFCVLLFGGVHLLTSENRTAFDYLEDVKTGGLTKRWQGAFELSKILSNPKLIPDDQRFMRELIAAFKQSEHDDNRVRQYLALAMGRTQKKEFVDPLLDALTNEKEENLTALIYALGMLQDKKAVTALNNIMDHPQARIRSMATAALGNIADHSSIPILKKALNDTEANVQWGAAISLARMGDDSGTNILLQLLNRKYLSQFSEVDQEEQNNLMIETIHSSATLNNKSLNEKIQMLAQSDLNMQIRSEAIKFFRN